MHHKYKILQHAPSLEIKQHQPPSSHCREIINTYSFLCQAQLTTAAPQPTLTTNNLFPEVSGHRVRKQFYIFIQVRTVWNSEKWFWVINYILTDGLEDVYVGWRSVLTNGMSMQWMQNVSLSSKTSLWTRFRPFQSFFLNIQCRAACYVSQILTVLFYVAVVRMKKDLKDSLHHLVLQIADIIDWEGATERL